MAPEVGQVVTVFRSRLVEGVEATYGPHAQRISALVENQPGHVEHKSFVAADGERLTVVTFADQASHDAWRGHPDHRAAQALGLSEYYESFTISVGTVEHARSFRRADHRPGRGNAAGSPA